MLTPKKVDVLIVGGGMVGASLACALGGKNISVAVVEAFPFKSSDQPSYDDRTTALSFGSRKIFESLGLWSALEESVTPIKTIHISDRGRFGMARIKCEDEGKPALGYVVANRVLGRVLMGQLARFRNVHFVCPAKLTALSFGESAAQAEVENGRKVQPISAKLVIAADGGGSTARKLAGIDAVSWDYKQSAVIANVTTEREHNFIAYERFTDEGPLALLPIGQSKSALVWTTSADDVEKKMSWSDQSFLGELQQAFGMRLGQFTEVGKRVAFPLKLVRPKELTMPRFAVIGNAAHTLHPVAGQGFNLGLRDVAAMAEVLCKGEKDGLDLGGVDVLDQYAKWRTRDHHEVSAFTDLLVRTFTLPVPPLPLFRNIGLLAVDALPLVKSRLANKTMGLSGKLPKLCRGLPL